MKKIILIVTIILSTNALAIGADGTEKYTQVCFKIGSDGTEKTIGSDGTEKTIGSDGTEKSIYCEFVPLSSGFQMIMDTLFETNSRF